MHVKIESLLIFIIVIVGIHCLDENCTQDVHCKTPFSVCVGHKCTCDKMSVKNDSECLPLIVKYKGYCKIAQQCEWLGVNSECRKNKCVCKEHHRWFQGTCRRYANKGEDCGTDIDCYSGHDYFSLKCDSSSNKCVCNDDYYDRGFDCRLKSKMGSDCAIDLDCQHDHLTCNNAICKLPKKDYAVDPHIFTTIEEIKETGELIKIKNESISCKFDEDCNEIGNSQCNVKSNTCHCLPETYQNGQNCLPGFGACDDGGSCNKMNNTECFKGSSCVCKNGYYLSNKACIPEMGVQDYNSQTEMDCKIRGGQLLNGTCYCRKYWFSNDTNQNCIKTMDQQHQTCMSSDSCNALGPYSYCNHTTESSTCQCSKFAVLNRTTYLCDKVSEQPKGTCLRDDDCQRNEICKIDKCQCIPNFSRDSNGTCMPKIGGSCEIDACSHIENVKCAGGICACATNTCYVESVNRCVKEATKLYDNCEFDQQCQKFKNVVCRYHDKEHNGTKQCVCSSEYVDVNMACLKKKKLGDPCTTSLDCTLVLNKSFQCRKSICQCPTNRRLKDGYCQLSGGSSLKPTQRMIILFVTMTILEILLHGKLRAAFG